MAVVVAAIHPGHSVGTVDRRLFGSFVEHLGRCVYTGIFEPGHPRARRRGLPRRRPRAGREIGRHHRAVSRRQLRLLVPLGRRRGTGGGTPEGLDLAWHSIDTNQFGTNEFMRWCAAAGVEPMMAVNIGTRGTAEAIDLLEYCTIPGGTALSDLRRSHGVAEPHSVRMWCLGNEMDGPWQVGHMSPDQYGRARGGHGARDAHGRSVLGAGGVRQFEPRDAHLRRVGARRLGALL